jgi:hypothetical protein
MPNPQRLLTTIRRARELFLDTLGRTGTVVQLDASAEDVLVAGDLHGNLANFQALLDRARLDRNPRRHLVLQELVHGEARYPNGGCKSHQLVDLVAALKCQYPDRVHLILGNHELAELLNKPILKAGIRTNDLFRQGIEFAYGETGDGILAGYQDLFRALPLAVRSHNRVFVSHSFPEASDLDAGFDSTIFQSKSIEEFDSQRSDSLHDLVWGRDGDETTARRFAAIVDADLVITGHMPCLEGFRSPNPLQLILDCSRFPACYCLFSNERSLKLADLLAGVRTL